MKLALVLPIDKDVFTKENRSGDVESELSQTCLGKYISIKSEIGKKSFVLVVYVVIVIVPLLLINTSTVMVT